MMTNSSREAFDVLGVGFGPSNLSLAIVIHEAQMANVCPLSVKFLEHQETFCWQPGMLVDDVDMQSSFLEDMVTARNPMSWFTFLNYLKEKGRLYQYLNLRQFYSSRNEFNDYLQWVAAQLGEYVHYGRTVLSVHPVDVNGHVDQLRVVVRTLGSNSQEEYRCRSLILATGGTPWVPQGTDADSTRIFHSHYFAESIGREFPTAIDPYRFLVVGGGQSAAEVFYHLLKHYPDAEVTIAFRQYALRPFDDSCFFNEIFDPEGVDFIFDLTEEGRHLIQSAYVRGNYSVVDTDLIRAIYKLLYEEKVVGKTRARVLRFTEYRGATEDSKSVVVRLCGLMTGKCWEDRFDGVVLATGYRRSLPHPLLANLAPYLATNMVGKCIVTRDYRLETTADFLPPIYVQGWHEGTHGLGDTLIPILPVRSYEIFQSLLRHLVIGHVDKKTPESRNLVGALATQTLAEGAHAMTQVLRQQ